MTEPNIIQLMKKLYSFTQSKKKINKRTLKIHSKIFSDIKKGDLLIQNKRDDITQEINKPFQSAYPKLDEQIQSSCISLYDIYCGKDVLNLQENKKQKYILKKREEQQKQRSTEKKEDTMIRKDYISKVKQWNKQKRQIDLKKAEEQRRKQKQRLQQDQKIIEQQKQLQKIKQQEKKKKLQQGIKQIEQRKKKRQQMVRLVKGKRSQSLKTLTKVPKYIQLQKKYLQNQRQKQQEAQQQSRKRQQQMVVKIQQIKKHQKAYIQKIKQKLNVSRSKDKLTPAITERKVKSEFNVFLQKNQEQQQKQKQKMARRKNFQSIIRNIPISVDPNKKKQKEIEVDKRKNGRKYNLLSHRALNDDQIYDQFKNFEVKIDPRQLGKNYLDELRSVTKQSRAIKMSSDTIIPKSTKPQYHNYLQQMRSKKSLIFKHPSEHRIDRKSDDQLMRLVERSRKYLKPENYQNEYNDQYEESMDYIVPLKQSKVSTQKHNMDSSRLALRQARKNDQKQQVSKSITQKIAEYEKKVLRKVKDLKQITQYDQTIVKQNEIDQLYAKVLKGKLATIFLDQTNKN